ncbi:LacI family DNA-binding transcriptional regulator [Amycolatopsis sp., V23-08]|uniref:LacI family DNA-binding transcriptional regulator n=1 Tax=Amycolatopsis heterodermiae TaxID=3110235 RepID=A0ABU5R896_9PSEU|nr:LacI family DNA-binding transcriptional regulator [Amycolatopsis sp., V23-08]MEA5362441.1 LacI family DNA-binding transcriptional regulator [Amycolatopsis sp., V23-08]
MTRAPDAERPAGGRRGPAPTGRPTMRDVASAASVSVKTVSRVVHNYPFISDDVRGRVQAEIRRLGFRPNSNAVGLRRTDRPAGGIGVLAADLADPFYAGMLSAIEQVATARSFTTLVASSDEDPARERGLLGTFVERRLDGLIVVSADRRHDHLRPELDVGTRMVFADRPPQRLPVDCVLAAHAEGAGQAVTHLLGQGHRAIAYVGHSPVIHTARERLRGFQAALAEAGLEPHAVRTDAVDAAAAHRAAAELLATPDAPTALFADNPRLVGGVARAIAESAAPRTALVVFDDSELAQVLGVTVVAQDPRELGRRAAELLFTRLDGDRSRPRRVVLPTTLVPRGSGEGFGVALRSAGR